MLKLEKRKSEVVVSLRNKEKLCSSTFLKAFLLAILFHFLALFLFHVSPFKVDNNNAIFAPISVHIDFQQPHEFTIAETESEQIRKRPVLEPKPTELSLPQWKTETRYFARIEMQPDSLNPFESVELHKPLNPLLNVHRKVPSVEVHVSGALADLPIAYAALPEAREVDAENRTRALYQVQVEGATGIIFWYRTIEEEKSLLAFGKELLHSMQFEPDPKQFVISGEIEIIKEI